MKVKMLSEDLGKVVKLVERMTDDIVFDAKDNMLQFKLVNIERTAFVELAVIAEVVEEGKVAFRVNDLKKIVRMFKKDEILMTDEEEGFVTFSSEKKTIKVPQIEADEFEQTLPEFDYTATFRLDKSEYKQILKDIKVLGDAIKISDDKITVVDSQYEYEYKLDDFEGKGSMVVGTNLFELPILLNAEMYVFKYGSDTPLVVYVDDEEVKGRFVIAPRIEE